MAPFMTVSITHALAAQVKGVYETLCKLLSHVMPEAQIHSWLHELTAGRYRPHEAIVV